MFGGGGYAGARSDRRALAEWKVSAGSADQVSLPDLPTLRARAQDLLRNAPIAVGAANTTVANAIGTGLSPQPAVDRELLGLTEEQADRWELQALRVWEAWAETPACDLAGRVDFYTMQAVTERAEWSDGDVFVLRRYVPRPGDVLGLKLQLIEADRVSNPDYRPDTERLAGGLEIDDDGRVVRYHVSDRNPWDFQGMGRRKWNAVPAYGLDSQERLVLHQYLPLRPMQTRGIPALAPVVEVLKQLDRYSEAELMAAVISAMYTVFVTSQQGQGLAPIGEISEDGGIGSTAPEIPSGEYRLGNGAIVDLMPGEDVKFADPKRPNALFDPFVLAILRQVGVALELPFEILVKHFSASYSASRAALLEAWRAVTTRRRRRIRQLCQPVWEMVVAEAVARRLLEAPGFFENPLTRRAWTRAEWTGPSMGQINPLDEVNAAEKRINLLLSHRAEETAQLTGGSWERKYGQMVKERRMIERDGLAAEAVAERIQIEPKEPAPAEGSDRERGDDEGGDEGDRVTAPADQEAAYR